jgi:hypothetical protein
VSRVAITAPWATRVHLRLPEAPTVLSGPANVRLLRADCMALLLKAIEEEFSTLRVILSSGTLVEHNLNSG